VAVGIGINVLEVPDHVDQEAASLAILRGDSVVNEHIVLEALCENFALRMGELKLGFEVTRKAWLARAEGLGKLIKVKRGSEVLHGVFEGLGAAGELTAGDVELVKERAV